MCGWTSAATGKRGDGDDEEDDDDDEEEDERNMADRDEADLDRDAGTDKEEPFDVW